MFVELTVDSKISFRYKSVRSKNKACWNELKRRHTYTNPDFLRNRQFGYRTQQIPAKIETFQVVGDTAFFSRGSLQRVRKILKQHGFRVKILDKRLSFSPIKFPSKIKLRLPQIDPVKAVLKKQQGIIRGPCSAGKTVILLEAIAQAQQPSLVIVWNTVHQKQWISEAQNSNLLNLKASDIGGVGGVFSKPKFSILNVCMQQSLWRKKNLNFFRDRVGFVGADECQRYAANTYQNVLDEFPAKYRIGVSANEKRRDRKEFLIYDSFGKVISNISEDVDIASRIKSNIFFVPTSFYSEQYDAFANRSKLLNELAVDDVRNKLIVQTVKKSLSKKKVCLILTERVHHALFFFHRFSDYRVGLLIGEQQTKKIRNADWPEEWKETAFNYDSDIEYQRVTRLAARKKLDIIIATQKGDVGLNIKTIDHGFITTATGGNLERFNQQKGRVERDYDDDLRNEFGPKSVPRVYYFWDTKNDRLRENGNMIMRNFPNVLVLRKAEKQR